MYSHYSFVYCLSHLRISHFFSFFFFNDTATTEIYTLSLHDALPIWTFLYHLLFMAHLQLETLFSEEKLLFQKEHRHLEQLDRKSTRLNSSHGYISYAVFCLKKKKK